MIWCSKPRGFVHSRIKRPCAFHGPFNLTGLKVCVCVRVFIFVHIYIYIFIYVYVCTYVPVCVYVCVYVCVFVHTYVCLCMCLCLYVFVCVWCWASFFHRGKIPLLLSLYCALVLELVCSIFFFHSIHVLSSWWEQTRLAASCYETMIGLVVCTTFDYSSLSIRFHKKVHTLDGRFW